jgi:phage-related protein
MRLTGAANQNYTLQMSTNLGSTNWLSLFVTNNTTANSFLLTDPNATNKLRFYRVLVGP